MNAAQANRAARTLALAAPLALMVGAYISQYGFGLVPCEMCWWQRYAHFAAMVFAALAYLRPPGRTLVVLAGVAIAVSGAIGGFHAGVEYGWWQGFTACTVTPTAGSGDPLAAILDAPLVRCDVAPWSFIGISLAGWNFLFSGASALAIAGLLQKGTRS
jgi:disulfide bond formation protein DsbB